MKSTFTTLAVAVSTAIVICGGLTQSAQAKINADVYQNTGVDSANISQKLMRQAKQINKSSSDFSTTVPSVINDHALVGTAFNRDTYEILNVQTVDGWVDESLGNTQLETTLSYDSSYEQVLDKISGSLDVGVTFVLVRVDVGGSIAKEMASDKFSTTYTFQAYATPKKRTLQPHNVNTGFTLTPSGDTIASTYQNKMQHLAGDSFISDIKYGAQLLVNLKVEYLNEQHKSDISGRLGVSYGVGPIGISVEGELRFIDEQIKQSVKITVQALQKGGDPKQLLKIIPNNIITCTLDNYEPCFDLFVQASNYARDEFGSQLNSLSDYNVVSYTAKPYSQSSLAVRQLDAGSQDVTLGTTYRSLWLNNAFKTSIGHEHRANALLTKYNGYLTEQERGNANHIKQAAYNNGQVYSQYAEHCQNNPYGSSCEDNWNDYLANCGSGAYADCIVNYSEGDLNVTSGDITRYFKCEKARQAAASFGVESVETSLAIRELSLAPVFIDPTDPSAGVINWLACKLALETYGTAFD